MVCKGNGFQREWFAKGVVKRGREGREGSGLQMQQRQQRQDAGWCDCVAKECMNVTGTMTCV